MPKDPNREAEVAEQFKAIKPIVANVNNLVQDILKEETKRYPKYIRHQLLQPFRLFGHSIRGLDFVANYATSGDIDYAAFTTIKGWLYATLTHESIKRVLYTATRITGRVVINVNPIARGIVLGGYTAKFLVDQLAPYIEKIKTEIRPYFQESDSQTLMLPTNPLTPVVDVVASYEALKIISDTFQGSGQWTAVHTEAAFNSIETAYRNLKQQWPSTVWDSTLFGIKVAHGAPYQFPGRRTEKAAKTLTGCDTINLLPKQSILQYNTPLLANRELTCEDNNTD